MRYYDYDGYESPDDDLNYPLGCNGGNEVFGTITITSSKL